MSRLILHSFRRCPFAIRARFALEEKGLEYTIIEEDLSRPSSELLKLNPSGQVPVLLHDGNVIPESAVITEYLEEVYPTPPLMPESPAGKAQVRLWTNWCAESFKPDLDTFKYEWDELSDSQARSELLSRLKNGLGRIAAQLEKHPFLLEERLTLADIHLFPFCRQLSKARPNDPGLLPFPGPVTQWMARIEARPSFARVMAKPSN